MWYQLNVLFTTAGAITAVGCAAGVGTAVDGFGWATEIRRTTTFNLLREKERNCIFSLQLFYI